MDKSICLFKPFGRGFLSIVPLLILLLLAFSPQVALSQTEQADDDQTMRNVVQYLMRVGTEQYEKGFYIQAEKTFLMAQDYQEYLTALERTKLTTLLQKAQKAAREREVILQQREEAYRLIGQGELAQAKTQLLKIKDSDFLTNEEKVTIEQTVGGINAKILGPSAARTEFSSPSSLPEEHQQPVTQPSGVITDEQMGEKEVAELYYQSLHLYRQGDLRQAREGFIRVLNSGLIPEPMAATIRRDLKRINESLASTENLITSPGSGRDELQTTLPQVTVAPLNESVPQPTRQANNVGVQQQQIEQIMQLYDRSVDLYYQGQLTAARQGFARVAESELFVAPHGRAPEDYIAAIDQLLLTQTEQDRMQRQLEPVVQANAPPMIPDTMQVGVPTIPVTETGQESYIEEVNRRRNIIREHTDAVVTDAVNQAQTLIDEGQFEKARDIVERANRTVNDNQLHLGDALNDQYNGKLEQTLEQINEAEQRRSRQLAGRKRREAIEAQRQFREQAEIDRQKSISELMERAKAYQKQQNYEAALGQIEALLAIDPQNEEAIILSNTLNDMIYFRKQLDIQKEHDKQRADILLKTDEAGIPYAEEIMYPKNWREIIQKPTRKPDEPMGIDPADAAVYDQLNQAIDLSDISPSMSFAEVLDRIENSVDPPVPIQANWRDLSENADIERSSIANMEPLIGVRLGRALRVLLDQVSGGIVDIDYVVEGGVISIATRDTLRQPKPPTGRLIPRVYDISDLISEPASYNQLTMLYYISQMMQSMSSLYGGYGGGGGGGYGGGGGGYGGGGGGYGGGGGGYGGGMSGGMGMGGMSGGMGMGGMSGMTGGMGGMGGMTGGMGGMGGYGGGMGGYGMMGGQSAILAQDLSRLIMDAVEAQWPESWLDTGGDGSIMQYPLMNPRKLAVVQTIEIHNYIYELLNGLRVALGSQVSIEARFLVVSESFLEDIGLDLDLRYRLGGKWGDVDVVQESFNATEVKETGISGGLGGIDVGGTLTGGYGSILDDLQVSFILRMAQAKRDAKALTAPKVTVLSGESAIFSIQRTLPLALPPIQAGGTTTVSAGQGTTTGTAGGLVPREMYIPTGSVLSISPTISRDKKYVLLNIMAMQNEYLGIRTTDIQAPIVSALGETSLVEWTVDLPETETAQLMTRVSVPDQGTLLLGGQKITSEIETEAGVPILSKLPIIGRAFSNSGKIRDHKILLILVKPTIIIQEEREQEAIAAMDGEL